MGAWDTLSASAANLDFSHAAARLAFAAATAGGTGRFISKHLERAWDSVSENLSFSVAHCTIPVTGRIAIRGRSGWPYCTSQVVRRF